MSLYKEMTSFPVKKPTRSRHDNFFVFLISILVTYLIALIILIGSFWRQVLYILRVYCHEAKMTLDSFCRYVLLGV